MNLFRGQRTPWPLLSSDTKEMHRFEMPLAEKTLSRLENSKSAFMMRRAIPTGSFSEVEKHKLGIFKKEKMCYTL